MSDEYAYEPLPNDRSQIRLLTLLPGIQDEIVECSIDHYKLPPKPKDADLWTPTTLDETLDGSSQTSQVMPILEYEAFLWTWGDFSEYRTVSVVNFGSGRGSGTKSLAVRNNLFTALKRLRYPKDERRLWIDAVCINQKEDGEKNLQVAMMSEIYSGARSVCIWLGETRDNSDLAMEFVSSQLSNLGAFQVLTDDAQYKPNWKALAALMTRPWFGRRWVVQEIALAKDAVVYCGQDEVDWTNFETAVSLFERDAPRIANLYMQGYSKGDEVDTNLLGDVAAMGATKLVKAKSDLFRRDDDGTILERRFTLGEPVANLASFEAKDPHDMVYAILALARDTFARATAKGEPPKSSTSGGQEDRASGQRSDKDPATSENASSPSHPRETPEDDVVAGADAGTGQENSSRKRKATDSANEDRRNKLAKTAIGRLRQGIRPQNARVFEVDYKQSFFDICTQFLSFTISKHEGPHNLDILCRPWAPKDEKEPLPSWIPSVTNAPFGRRQADHGPAGFQVTRKNYDPLVGLSASSSSYYNACRGHRADTEHDWHFGKQRNLFVTGFILDRIGTAENYSSNGDIPAEWLHLADWEPEGQSRPGQKGPPERLWRTLVADRGEDGRNIKVYYAPALEFARKYSTAENGIETTNLLQRHNPILYEFLARMRTVVFNRKLFKSKRANHLGLAPKTAQPGDCICILKGCSVPIALRRHGAEGTPYYTFIGECYVHTMMDGKAMDEQDSRSREFERLRKSGFTFTEEQERHEKDLTYRKFELR